MRNKWIRGAVHILAPLLFWGGLLFVAALAVNNKNLLPTPFEILESLWQLLGRPDFRRTVFSSLGRVLGGLLVGILSGTLLGILSHLSRAANLLIRPFLTVIRSTPVASFVILVWSFTGSDRLPFLIAAAMVLPIVADELSVGLAKADDRLGEVAELYGLSPWRRFLVHRLPAALPYFFGAIISSVGFAWKAGIAAEILATTAGSIGRSIYFSKLYLMIPELWAWTLTAVILSLFLEVFVSKTLHYVERRAGWKV